MPSLPRIELTRRKKVALSACSLLAFALQAASATPPRSAEPASVGPLPAVALALPADSQVLMGISVRSFVSSRFYERFAQPGGPLRPTVLDELRRQTGLDGERDLDQIVVATGRPGEIVILAIGRLDLPRLESVWRRRARQGPVYTLAFLSERALALGSSPWIGVISGKIAGADLRTNAAMLTLVRQIPERANFWMVAEGGAVSRLIASNAKSPAVALLPLGLPPLKSIIIASEVAPSLAGETGALLTQTIQADAVDEKSARGLADMLRGFVALIALQSPALRDLPGAVEVATQDTNVRLTARLTSEMLEALVPRGGTPEKPVPATSTP